ncbi:MAG: neutral/alkaline non-lysosomal ceramidase N-terminal domain-containing protein [Acidobacteria bacterium]|nr:neutral/alkaline non-lysosomal ceramidase N-terminal domain-containing protein [Acidobacteriota bacterium]
MCLAGSFISVQGFALRAGAAKTSITPDVHAGKVYMAGFDSDRVATGIHDNLYARCLAIGTGQKTLVVCAADLIGLFHPDVLKVRSKVESQLPAVTRVIVTSTHDHEGPDTLGLWGPGPLKSGVNPQYLNWVVDRIAATAIRAVNSMQEASMTLARDHSPLLNLLQDDSRPPYVKDPYLFLMRFTSAATGKPIATLINWSDHPEVLASKNTLITADYPHWLCRYVEEHEGGTAVFVNGSVGGLLSALGNQVSLLDPETGQVATDGTWEKARLVGNTVGEVAVRALRREGHRASVDRMVIRHAEIDIPLSNKLFRLDEGMGVLGQSRPVYTNGKLDPAIAEKPLSFLTQLIESYGGGAAEAAGIEKQLGGLKTVKYATGRDIRSEVDYIQFLDGRQVVAEIATIPGEIYPELVNGGITRYPGADFPDARFEPILRPHLKSQYQFIFGLANDEIGYIIPRAEWDNRPPWLKNRSHRWYGEINSVGPDAAGMVTGALVKLIDEK